MKTNNIFPILITSIFTSISYADNSLKFSELRILATTNTFATEPTALNNLTAADNVQKLDTSNGIGLEADAKYKAFKVGTRFKYVLMSKEPIGAAVGGPSALTISQYTVGLLGRYPIVDNDLLTFDVVAELGMANTSFDVKTIASGNGTFKKDGSFFQRAGAAFGVGWPSAKFYFEVGQEWNKLDDMSFTGTIANNINSVDLSGPYFSIGLIISGMPSWITPGGITFGK